MIQYLPLFHREFINLKTGQKLADYLVNSARQFSIPITCPKIQTLRGSSSLNTHGVPKRVKNSESMNKMLQHGDEVEKVEVNIFVCVSVQTGQNRTFSLFFSHNQPEKCNTCVLLLFSARKVSVAQAKKWKEKRHCTTCLTLNPQWAKSFWPGTIALHQIRYFESTQATMLLKRKLPFARLVCEIAQDYKTDLRFTATAILALHHASEYFLMEVMKKTHLAALHHERIMIAPRDMHLVKAITYMW